MTAILQDDPSGLEREIARRRTFAIISHPDAGKTTLTEKLLLYGGAIDVAGAVRSRREQRKTTSDWMAIEHQIIAHLSGRGIEFPSEHNVGHLYQAKPVLADFYRALDPTNTLNPGIGRTSKRRNWA